MQLFIKHGTEQDLNNQFERIAKELFYNGYFQVGLRKIYLLDIEFYYHEEGEGSDKIHDYCMYHINAKLKAGEYPYFVPGSFHEHQSGLDFCFESEENKYRASVLIRGIRIIEGNQVSYEFRPQFIPSYFLMGNSVFDGGYNVKWVDVKTDITPQLPEPKERKGLEGEKGCYRKWRYSKPILTDNLTSTVYLSENTKRWYPNVYKRIVEALDRHNVNHCTIPHTRDIWCRDYMPIQLDTHFFLKYRYKPDYLNNNSFRQYNTDCADACKAFDISYAETDCVIDGGNMIKTPTHIIMTDKVYKENGCVTTEEKARFRNKLTSLFGVKPLLLPWDEAEELGHADGLVRYLGNNRLLLANYNEWQGGKSYYKRIRNQLENAGYSVYSLELRQGEYAHEDTWMYLNFLQTRDLILVPKINDATVDAMAFSQFQTLFPEYSERNAIEMIDVREITDDKDNGGGSMNCISWNISCHGDRS